MTSQVSDDERPHVVRDVKGKRPEFYLTPGLDQAMSMIMVLANEVSVLHDRLDSMERVHSAKGLDMAAEIEAVELSQEALEAREGWRQSFLERLYYLVLRDSREAAKGETDESFRATINEIAIS